MLIVIMAVQTVLRCGEEAPGMSDLLAIIGASPMPTRLLDEIDAPAPGSGDGADRGRRRRTGRRTSPRPGARCATASRRCSRDRASGPEPSWSASPAVAISSAAGASTGSSAAVGAPLGRPSRPSRIRRLAGELTYAATGTLKRTRVPAGASAQPDPAAVGLDDRAGDRQAEPGAAARARRVGPAAVERLEHLLALVGRRSRRRCRRPRPRSGRRPARRGRPRCRRPACGGSRSGSG